jgi:RHS repeat-associated protein
VTHRFVYDPDGRVLGEYGASASDVIAETIWMSPEVAANDNEPLGGDDGVGGYAPLAVATGSGSSAALTWLHGNHLGVPIAFTDTSGTATSPPSYSLPGFPGQMKTLSEIYYNRYRDYDSSLGRYVQADPLGLGGGSNPYLYAKRKSAEVYGSLGVRDWEPTCFLS